MTMETQTKQDTFEDFLTNNQFYLGPSNSSNHVTNLRQSVHIPNSISSQSINGGLLNEPAASANQRTSIMKNSPSMKALESILLERNGSALQMKHEPIEEEEEDALYPPNMSALSISNFGGDPNRGSTYSVQTFETAHSNRSFADPVDNNGDDGKTAKSISTIDEGYSTNDDTPILANAAQFQTFTHVNGSNKSAENPIRVVKEASTEDLDGQSTNVSNRTTENEDTEHDDTLIENDVGFKSQYEQQQQQKIKDLHIFQDEQRQRKLELENYGKQLLEKEQELQKYQEYRQNQQKQADIYEMQRRQHLERQKELNNEQERKLREEQQRWQLREQKQPQQPMPLSKSRIVHPSDRNTEVPGWNQTVDDVNTSGSKFSEPLKKSPHTRSNSAFSLNFTKNKEQPPLPGKAKRSSTFNDLSSASNKTEKSSFKKAEKVPSTKKFSIKNLFKSKNKAPKKDDDLVSKPKKLSSKSFSTPNISSFNDYSNTKDEKESNKKNSYEEPVQSRKQIEPVAQKNPQKTHKLSSSLLSVFKKDKVSDSSSKLVKSDVEEQVSNKPLPNAKVEKHNSYQNNFNSNSIAAPNHEPQSLPNHEDNNNNTYEKYNDHGAVSTDSNSNNPNINFIREVTDDDIVPDIQYLTPKITETKFDNVDDIFTGSETKNLGDLGDLGANASLMPKSKSVLLNDETLFGSPFKVKYSPLQDSPQRNSQGNKDTNLKARPEVNDQLLGETLFPKSLNAQEVESIVSLERSRSMRSLRSNKRNSFVNYNGSDENVIQYDGTAKDLNKSNMSRSSSILKNSNSKRNLNVNDMDSNMNSINAQILGNEDPVDNYHEFIEFTDYIDFDNLDFSVSPNAVINGSPRVLSPTASVLSDSLDNTPLKKLQAVLHEKEIQQYPQEDQIEILSDSTAQESNSIQEISPPLEKALLHTSTQVPTVLLSTPPPSQEDDQHQNFTYSPYAIESSKFTSTGDDTEPASGPLTPNLEIINSNKIPQSPESIKLPEPEFIEKSPLLDSAYNNPALVNEDDKNVSSRPISMSFKGLKGPSFGGKLAMHDLRSSASHQSFNMSFGDEDEMSPEIGAGFGSSGEEDEVDEEDELDNYYDKFENKENSFEKSYPLSYGKYKDEPQNNYNTLPPPQIPNFTDNKIPLISSNNSSPKSISSLISRKFKKSPNLNASGIKSVSTRGGVRFSSRIILYDTYNGEEYDRHPDNATCNQLTPALAQQIKEELNNVKSEMSIHKDSRCYTHFF